MKRLFITILAIAASAALLLCCGPASADYDPAPETYTEGDYVYSVTAASGMPINEENNNNVEKSQVRQGYLEGSNVQVADEMVNLIIAQRAYEFNSKAIQAADTMMQEANELRR